MSVKRKLLPPAIIIAAIAISFGIASSRKTPPRTEHAWAGPLVEVVTVTHQEHPVTITGQGTVQAKTSVQVVPQVSGKVVTIHPQLTAGGYFAADEPLITIEATDYELTVQRARAAVARAQVDLQLQEAEAEVARREWNRLHPGKEPESPLVVRQPQVDQAHAALASASADLATAELNLARTSVNLPFAGRVLEESVDIGQFVVAGQSLAEVYATAVMEIPVPLPDADLAWFELPGPGSDARRTDAAVSADFAGETHRWQGKVVRSQGQVDPQTRMVQVVVEVRATASHNRSSQQLVPGMFVTVDIAGDKLSQVAIIPRYALHNGNQVWVNQEGRLRIVPVEVAYLEHDNAYIRSGLPDQAQVVLSQLDVVSDGMQIRVTEAGQDGEEEV